MDNDGQTSRIDSLRTPPLGDELVRLRAIEPRDYDPLYRLSLSPDFITRWRFRGSTPSPEDFRATLWQNVLVQFIVEFRSSPPQPVGLVSAYNANHRNQLVYLSVLSASQARARGVVFAGLELFISYIFRNWQFRKIYFETFEFNLGQFASASGLVFDIEGRLRDYEYMDGRYWDLIVGSIHRNDWPKRLHERRSEVSSRGEALRNAVPPTDLLSEEPFCRLLEDMRNESGVKEAIKVTLDTEWADLALDSLEALELLDLLEGLTGTTISDGSDVTRWTFVRDIYRFYLELAQRPIRGS